MRLPAVTGMWPAFWLLGANIDTVGWPACGEIDIVEGKGRLPNWTSGALNRGPSSEQNRTTWEEFVLPVGDFHTDWRVFALEWTPGLIRWFVDDEMFLEVERPVPFDPRWWPYDEETPYFIILNLAVGGHFDAPHLPPPDYPPQQLLVDWVRVYSRLTP
jgi:beta-glucanase (GH16 family)